LSAIAVPFKHRRFFEQQRERRRKAGVFPYNQPYTTTSRAAAFIAKPRADWLLSFQP
jgi:hypothetical protein